MTRARASTVLRAACVLALVALGLMLWSLFDPRPPPVLVALSLGQALGTLSFMAYLSVVVHELWSVGRERRRAPRESVTPPSSSA
jgi:hypothetical protein